jgi:hypothetical protein
VKKEKNALSKRKNIKEMESIRNIIRLLILETIIPLYILFMSLIYGEGIKLWMLIGLLIIAIITTSSVILLWKFRNKNKVVFVAKILSIIILFPESILVKVTLSLIAITIYYLGIIFVIICVIFVLTIWTINSIKELREKK